MFPMVCPSVSTTYLRMLARDLPAHTFVHEGLWLDIGRVDDFQNAQELAWDNQTPAFQVVAAA